MGLAVSANASLLPDCLNLGVCRFDLQIDLATAGVDMCYHFQTGLVGKSLKLLSLSCNQSLQCVDVLGQCLQQEPLLFPIPTCDKKTVIACHPFPHLAEAVFGTLMAGSDEEDSSERRMDSEQGRMRIVLPDGRSFDLESLMRDDDAAEMRTQDDPEHAHHDQVVEDQDGGDADADDVLLNGLSALSQLAQNAVFVVGSTVRDATEQMAHWGNDGLVYVGLVPGERDGFGGDAYVEGAVVDGGGGMIVLGGDEYGSSQISGGGINQGGGMVVGGEEGDMIESGYGGGGGGAGGSGVESILVNGLNSAIGTMLNGQEHRANCHSRWGPWRPYGRRRGGNRHGGRRYGSLFEPLPLLPRFKREKRALSAECLMAEAIATIMMGRTRLYSEKVKSLRLERLFPTCALFLPRSPRMTS